MNQNSIVSYLKLCNNNSKGSDGSEQQNHAKMASPKYIKNNSAVFIVEVRKWDDL